MVTQATEMHFAPFGWRCVVGGSVGQRGVEAVFHDFHICPYIAKEGLSRFGEYKRGLMATGEHVEHDLRNVMKAGVLQRLAYEAMRCRRGHLEAIVASHQAERKISMHRRDF